MQPVQWTKWGQAGAVRWAKDALSRNCRPSRQAAWPGVGVQWSAGSGSRLRHTYQVATER